MIIRRNLKWKVIWQIGWQTLVIDASLGLVAFLIYDVLEQTGAHVPLAVSGTLGTALALVISFRNSASYDRWWEARKIWGSIVNNSRTFARQVLTMCTLQHVQGGKTAHTQQALRVTHKTIIYRQIAFINALKLQLRGVGVSETKSAPIGVEDVQVEASKVVVVEQPQSQVRTLHQGWLKKRGGFNKALKERLFTLRSDKSLTYAKSDAPNTTVQGTIDVSQAISVDVTTDGQNTFLSLSTPKRDWIMMTAGESDAKDWQRAIDDLLSGGGGGGGGANQTVLQQRRSTFHLPSSVQHRRMRMHSHETHNWSTDVKPFVSAKEFSQILSCSNPATQILLNNSIALKDAHRDGVVDNFRHMQIDSTITLLQEGQGKCERIKNTPLARQYDFYPKIFRMLFITLLPFGLVEPLSKAGTGWLVIPLNGFIGFVFFIISKIGYYNEDPFENRVTDTPLNAICRTIEIELREALGEKDLPPKSVAHDGYLM